MESIFEKLWRLGPAAFVLKAIVVVIVADGLLLGFILLRRTYRKWYFAKRDAHVFELRQNWDRLISGEIPYETWRQNSIHRPIFDGLFLFEQKKYPVRRIFAPTAFMDDFGERMGTPPNFTDMCT